MVTARTFLLRILMVMCSRGMENHANHATLFELHVLTRQCNSGIAESKTQTGSRTALLGCSLELQVCGSSDGNPVCALHKQWDAGMCARACSIATGRSVFCTNS